MPLSDHVDQARRLGSNGEGMGATGHNDKMKPATGGDGRTGDAVDLSDESGSLFKPILSHLPSLSSISSLKGFLPTTFEKVGSQADGKHSATPERGIKAVWQVADLQDGRGTRHYLLVSSQKHALQIFSLRSSTLPEDPHTVEVFAPPEVIFSLPRIQMDDKRKDKEAAEVILDARLLRNNDSARSGPSVVLVIGTPTPRRAVLRLSLNVVSLRTGLVEKSRELGLGSIATLSVSARVIAVAVSHSTSSIHLFSSTTLEPLLEPIIDLPNNDRTGLPIFALSGRLLAYATSEAVRSPGAEGNGSLVTARTTTRLRSSTSDGVMKIRSHSSNAGPSENALLTSAVEIGGGVARGVWAGLKMGAKAANNRLAKSAPTGASGIFAVHEQEDLAEETDRRSLGDSSTSNEAGPSSPRPESIWIKVIDLGPAFGPDTEAVDRVSSTIAHFRLPLAQSLISPLSPNAHLNLSPGRSPSSVCHLSFSPDGTKLLAAPSDGRTGHILDIRPSGPTTGNKGGEVWHVYELRRGNTSADICDVSWSEDGRWIGIGTDKGTTHIFPINPTGGPPSAASHATLYNANQSQLSPLSTVVVPIARIRPQHTAAYGDQRDLRGTNATVGLGITSFTNWRADPLETGKFLQDIAVFRPESGRLETSRLSVKAQGPEGSVSPIAVLSRRASSGLSEMVRQTSGLGARSDLSVVCETKTRWLVPLGTGSKASHTHLMHRSGEANTAAKRYTRSLAQAEVRCFSINPHVLPSSIYLSRQVECFAARAIDEYSPLSMLDIEARSHRLIFRHEVEVQSATAESRSFDGPLSTALHSVIESPPASAQPIPGLPNGHPGRARWASLPIRQVTVGLGESVDRVRREYVRARNSRTRKRAANGLSFEEEAVFADDGGDTSPSSGDLGATTTTTADTSVQGEDEWSERWEDEYKRAVEDDGGPDDLVLGLLDEEEEERRAAAAAIKGGKRS